MIFHSPLTTHRKRWAMTQHEVGALVGLTRSSISRIEQGQGPVSLKTALALETLFDMSVSALMPHTHHAAAAEMLPRLAQFSITVEGEEGARGDRRRKLLQIVGERLANNAVGL